MSNIEATTPLHIEDKSKRWVTLCALIYGLIFLLLHLKTPFGRVAVLDGQELLQLAAAMAAGEYGSEPFHRGPLYPFLLSLPLRVGLPQTLLMPLALLVNVLLHTGSVLLVCRIAARLWPQHRHAGITAGFIYAIYPTAVYFTGEPLDVTLSITLMLLGLNALLGEGNRRRNLLLSGLYLVLAAAARPHMLAAGVALALAGVLFSEVGTWRHRLAPLLGLAIGLTALAGINAARSGHFTPMPTQGGYNLWVANNPQSNGRYFVHAQTRITHEYGTNPARAEAHELFLAAHPGINPASVNESTISSYWRSRAIDHIASSPGQWLQLMGGKLLALLHNTEQYNNKTYAFHKQANPVLRFNPLGWGILLLLALPAVLPLLRTSHGRSLLLVLTAYAAGVILFFASARFRLPLAPLLCVLAGGGVYVLREWLARWRESLMLTTLACLLGLTAFAHWPFSWARASDTYIEDWLLRASAEYRLGQYSDSLQSLDQALNLQSDNPRALQLRCNVGFNQMLVHWAQVEVSPPGADHLDWCRQAANIAPDSRWAFGVLLWRAGNGEQAHQVWREQLISGGVEQERALAALIMTEDSNEQDLGLAKTFDLRTANDLLLHARARTGEQAAGEELLRRQGRDASQRDGDFYARLFSKAPVSRPSDGRSGG